MRQNFTDIESIIQEGISGSLNCDAFYSFCTSENVKFDDLCNAIALIIAKRFNDSSMTYDDADGVANALSGLMIAHVTEETDASLPEPAWTIYLAFDAGEYDRGDGSDPVELFTRPLVKHALGEA
jgi:hypothetical protein